MSISRQKKRSKNAALPFLYQNKRLGGRQNTSPNRYIKELSPDNRVTEGHSVRKY